MGTQSVDCPCGEQEMRPQQWSTNVGWLIGFICLLSVSCQGDEHQTEDLLDILRLIPPNSKRPYYTPYFEKKNNNPYQLNNNYADAWWWYNKRAPGSEFLGKRAPGSEFLGKRVPGSEFLGKRVPGSEFLGKRNTMPSLTPEEEVELYNVMEDLTNQKRSLEVPLPYAQKTDRLHYELDTEDH